MTLSTVFPITVTIERFVAMKKAKSYEKMKVILGPALVLIVILIDFSIIFYIYKDENFGTGSISFMIFPSSDAAPMFGLFFIILRLNILNFLFNLFLFRQNSHLKRYALTVPVTFTNTFYCRKNFTLATKYQLEEVYLSTKLVVSIIFSHAIFFAFYLFTMNLSGLIGKKLIEDPINLWALNGVLMSLIATYNLVIGILSIHLYNRIRAKKTIDINGKVQMKSTGNAGALNYDNAIFSIWNSASSLSSRKTI
ncbi:hypothetical protein CAEBREN_13703 [Caenorhabditis brenneri]|uniref:Serpentine receptor class gamma n=1 Tax=Caenorhabditis brenneri TaxID=135651 RepID=G0N5L7_CAEBE|nr:hypothetical protein CAEBREN_13703 [Caenorhabditis brenneri]